MPFKLTEKRHRKINDNDRETIYLYVVKKDDLNEFKKAIIDNSNKGQHGVNKFIHYYDVDPREIYAYGTSEYRPRICEPLLRSEVVMRLDTQSKMRCYCCYGAIDHFNRNRVTDAWHTDPEESWNCLMKIMGMPKHLIIRRVKKDKADLPELKHDIIDFEDEYTDDE